MKKFFLIVLIFIFSACSKTDPKPNVIFILVDDLGWNDLGYTGSKFYESPNIDKLSNDSFEFHTAYAASSVCSPTRASIMTGKHPARVNITDWIPGVDPKNRPLLGPQDLHQLPLDETTIAEKLKQSGYKTFYAGKWHLGSQGYYPEENGFDINIGGFEKGSPMGGYYSPYKNPKLSDGPEGEYLTDRLTSESISFIENHDKSQPFVLFLSFYNVHTPIQPNLKHVNYFKEKLDSMDDNKVRVRQEGKAISLLNQINHKYASMVYAMDENVGRLINSLKENNLYQDALIIFTSDNGGLSTQKRVAPTSVFPLRAGKGWLYEGGIRIPQLIKTPGKSENVKIEDVTVSYDLFPTILDYVGLKSETELDGKSLMPLLEGKSKIEREEVFWHFPHYHGSLWKPGSAIRKGDWKLVQHFESNTLELYNLKSDIGEMDDLSSKFPEKTQDLLNRLNNLRKETNANSVSINKNFKQ
ncbi:MAG: arylsulfatase [Flavobacteriaceae bacterium]|nr:arylsulfatase [Flavobacteriaceae bacterium]|tara:strand:- start:1269 stop:2678 length:1410 start_codon:yes stop_codon:yes gene_type:complete